MLRIMCKSVANRAMSDVELAIELLIVQFPAVQQQLPGGPGVVAEQSIENIHEQKSRCGDAFTIFL